MLTGRTEQRLGGSNVRFSMTTEVRAGRWQTPEAKELASWLSLEGPEAAMRLHARNLLALVNARSLPGRLPSMFDWAGIRKVRAEPMPFEGALRKAQSGLFDILVRADRPPNRQR